MDNAKNWHNGDFPAEPISHSNDNWVCTSCQKVFRHSKMITMIPSCTKCSKELINFGSQFEAPRKKEKKKWKELKKLIENRKNGTSLENEAN